MSAPRRTGPRTGRRLKSQSSVISDQTSFRTQANGSLPRPDWLLEGYREMTEAKISPEAYNTMVDDAVKLNIKEQELARLDVITDGEPERSSFVGYIGSRLPGFAIVARTLLNPDAEKVLRERKTLLTKIRAVCVGAVEEGDLGVTDYEKANAFVQGTSTLKVSLAAPYLVMWETWHSTKSKEAYPDPVEMAKDYAKVLRSNILRLYAKGLRFVTIDEPMVGDLTEADSKPDRYHEGLTLFYGQKYRGFKEELKLGVDLLNAVIKGLPQDLKVTVHMDRWPNSDSPHFNEGYERLLPEILDVRCSQFDVEYRSSGCGNPVLFANPLSQDGKSLGLGCVSVTDPRVETPEEIVKFVKPVARILGGERLMLVPNCGFAPGMGKRFPREAAFAKFRSMVSAAEVLRRG